MFKIKWKDDFIFIVLKMLKVVYSKK